MSVQITEKDVQYVANLARLDVPNDEVGELTRKMGDIITLANKLSEVNTDDVEPTNLAINLQNVFRNDEVRPSFPRDDMIDNAPTKSAGCYSVPQTFDE